MFSRFLNIVHRKKFLKQEIILKKNVIFCKIHHLYVTCFILVFFIYFKEQICKLMPNIINIFLSINKSEATVWSMFEFGYKTDQWHYRDLSLNSEKSVIIFDPDSVDIYISIDIWREYMYISENTRNVTNKRQSSSHIDHVKSRLFSCKWCLHVTTQEPIINARLIFNLLLIRKANNLKTFICWYFTVVKHVTSYIRQ